GRHDPQGVRGIDRGQCGSRLGRPGDGGVRDLLLLQRARDSLKMGGPEMAPQLKWGAPRWPPKPPNARRAPAKPCRASIIVIGDGGPRNGPPTEMGGPKWPPQTPQRSSRPGEAVPRLDHRHR